MNQKCKFKIKVALAMAALVVACSSCIIDFNVPDFNLKAAQYSMKAFELGKKGELEKAVRLADKAINMAPKSEINTETGAELYSLLGDKKAASVSETDRSEAQACYEKAIRYNEASARLSPVNKSTYYYHIALIYVKLRNYEKAKTFAKKMLKLDPSDSFAKSVLDEIKEKTGS
jgi:tetratricopeptide (TPR) repeat protein